MGTLDRLSLFWCLHKFHIGTVVFAGMSAVLLAALAGLVELSSGLVIAILYSSNLFVLVTLMGTGWQKLAAAQVVLPGRALALDAAAVVPEDKIVEKSAFISALDQLLRFRSRDGLEVGTIFCDIDLFKEINDTFGHAAGDEIIKVVSERIREAVRQQDIVARMGGDEFAIILPGIETDMQVLCIADRIMNMFAEPVDAVGNEIFVSLTMGISISDKSVTQSDQLLARSDGALLQAKSVCRGTIHFYDKSMESEEDTKRQIEQELKSALERGEFSLQFETATDVRSGKPAFLQAQLEWNNETLGCVPKSQFIPIAESCGLMTEISLWTLEQAYNALEQLNATGHTRLGVTVNISTEQLKSSTFTSNVAGIALRYPGLTSRLILDMHENVMADDRFNMQAKINNLREMGFKVCLDDFGTGNASIGMIRRAKFDAIKVSKRLVRDLPDNSEMQSLVSAICSLGRSMSVDVIASGVDTPEIRGAVSSMDFNALQGGAICGDQSLEGLASGGMSDVSQAQNKAA